MSNRVKLCLTGMALFSACRSDAVLIDFELGGPWLFSWTNPLRTEYLSVGANFYGPSEMDGGAVVNAVTGNWGVVPRSGTDILAFNPSSMLLNGGFARGPEKIVFTNKARAVSIWFTGNYNQTVCTLDAYDNSDRLIASDIRGVQAQSWSKLSVSAPNISYVMCNTTTWSWAVDDLDFTPVPEPTAMVALSTGLILACCRRRKRSKNV